MKLKEEIVEFVRETYRGRGSVPSIREVLRRFGICRVKFYGLFPNGVSELCHLAGVPVPSERVRVVKRALEARKRSMERLERGEVDVKKRLEKVKSEFKRMISEYEDYVELLKYEAIMDFSKIPSYVREVVPKTKPKLWYALTRFGENNVDNVILEVMSQKPTYIEYVKSSKIRGGKPLDFRRYVEEALEEWLQRAIKLKLFSQVKPGLASGKCHICGSALEYRRHERRIPIRLIIEGKGDVLKRGKRGEEYSLICPNCKEIRVFYCPICNTKMQFKPVALKCPNCGYRLVFENKILPKITVNYAAYCSLFGIQDPRLKGKALVIVRRMPDGSEKIDWVVHQW